MARRHELDGLAAQDAPAVERAAVQHHLQEARVVGGRREQPRAAGEVLARAVDVVALADRRAGRRRTLELGRVLRIHGGQTVLLARREVELRVAHAERLEDALAQDLVERLTGHDFDERAQDVGVVAVDPRRAGLRVCGQARDAAHGVADRLVLVGEVVARLSRRGPQVAADPVAVAEARRVREQVAHRDRPPAFTTS